MEEKKIYGLYQKTLAFAVSPAMEKIWLIAVSFLGGFISTRALAFGKYAPFSVAFAAAAPKGGTWAAVIGGIAGYMLPTAAYMPFRYMVTLVAVGAIKWALSELHKINKSVFFAPMISFLPLISTGMTMVLINNSLPSMAAMYLAESFLASGVSFFFARAVKLVYSRKMRGVFDNTDIASLLVSFAVIVLSFNELDLYGVSLGRILMILTILLCSGSGGIAGGSISGIAMGAIGGLSGIGLSYLSGAYGLAGLMAGVFSSIGKVYTVVAFIIAHGIASLQIGSEADMLCSTIEVAVATIAYMFMPKNQAINNIFTYKKDSSTGEILRNNIVLRLQHASGALGEISGCVNEISEKLAQSVKTNIGQVYNKSASEICAGCSLRSVCWKKDKQASIAAFASLTAALKGKGRVDNNDFKPYLRDRCGRIGDMRESVNKNYKEFIEKQKAEIRAAEVRDISKEQFQITSSMLEDMASEFSLYQNFDEEAGERIANIFKKMNIYPVDVCCRTDSHNRMTVEAKVDKSLFKDINKTKLTREISSACGRIFALPCISNTEQFCKIQMCQKPLLEVEIGMAQQSADSFCGDSLQGFYDGQGRYVAVLSDGMGTGGMAAVDGNLACSMAEALLKAGIGYTTALRLINSALMSKCQDETLATLDIATLDLFTGKCEFRKAGATGTVIKKGKKAVYIEKESLPVGIMEDVKFSLINENLKKGDVIVLMSDGVTVSGQDWICETVENYIGDQPEELAENIVSFAKKNRIDGRSDDVSAFVIMIAKEAS